MPDPRSAPRSMAAERFVTEAARLFAEQGYAATSVADIQVACGLTAGSGALYKHFASKRALLDSVVQVHLDSMRSGAMMLQEEADVSLAEALRFVAEVVHECMQRDREALRIILRDLDAAPDLLDRVWSELDHYVYGEFQRWLSGRTDINLEGDELNETAIVLLAGLSTPALLSTLIHRTPRNLELAAFRSAWVEVALAALTRR